MNQPHPIQPLALDEHGTMRFKENAIVRYLLDHGGIDLNRIAVQGFSEEDQQQFAQLIGYSLSGYADLSYVDDVAWRAAETMAETGISHDAARALAATDRLNDVRESIREGIALLFERHPDDLA